MGSDARGTEVTPSNSKGADLPAPATAVMRALFRQELKWIVPFLGGLGLAVHFWRIGYAPSLSFGDLGTAVGAFVMFSFYAMALIVALVLAPTAVLGYWIEHHILPPPIRAMPASQPRKSLKSLRTREDDMREGFLARIKHLRANRKNKKLRTRSFRAPFSNVRRMLWELPAAALLALAAHAVLVTRFDDCNPAYRYIFWALFSGSFLVLMFVSLFQDGRVIRLDVRRLRHGAVRIALLVALYLAYWPFLIALLLGTVPTALDEPSPHFLLMTLALILMLHFSIYAAYRKSSNLRLTTVAGGIVMVLLYSQVLFAIVDSAINRFGFGMMRDVELIVTRKGCDIASAAWPGSTCLATSNANSVAYRLGRVDVFTRIGPSFLVGSPGSLKDPTKPRFTIPADQVLSWSRPPKARPTTKNCR